MKGILRAFGGFFQKSPPIPGGVKEAEASRPVAWSSMAGFLEDLEQVGEQHQEMYDTDVREKMWEVVERVLIKLEGRVEVPDDLGMFTSEGNMQLKAAMMFNLHRLREVFEVLGVDTEKKRLASFFISRIVETCPELARSLPQQLKDRLDEKYAGGQRRPADRLRQRLTATLI